MFIYLWNLCKIVLLKITAISWNVVIKLVQGEQPQQQLMNNTAKGKVRVSMANEVWTDVLSFVKRVELAHSVSLTNRYIHQICWPRLHGNRVMAHEVEEVVISCRPEISWLRPWQITATAKILMGGPDKEIPFANCSPPDYITGFRYIGIVYLDDQVLAFIKLIAPHLTPGVYLEFEIQMGDLDEQQRGLINQLLKIFREETPTLTMYTKFGNIQFLPDMDNKTLSIELGIDANTDIPLLVKWLATPRPDGQQRVIWLCFGNENDPLAEVDQFTMEMMDAIKQDFRTCNQPLPQPFCIICDYPGLLNNLNIPPRSEEENAQTDETLTVTSNRGENGWWRLKMYRYPTGEHGKWSEDARKRIQALDNNGRDTNIRINLYPWPRTTLGLLMNDVDD